MLLDKVRVYNHAFDIDVERFQIAFYPELLQCSLISTVSVPDPKKNSYVLVSTVMEDDRGFVTLFTGDRDFPISVIGVQGYEYLGFSNRIGTPVHLR